MEKESRSQTVSIIHNIQRENLCLVHRIISRMKISCTTISRPRVIHSMRYIRLMLFKDSPDLNIRGSSATGLKPQLLKKKKSLLLKAALNKKMCLPLKQKLVRSAFSLVGTYITPDYFFSR